MSFWADRNPSEKRMLIALATVTIIAGLGQALWSAYHDTIKLRKEVPALKSQLEEMKQKAEEWHSLSSRPTKNINRNSLRSDVEAQLTTLGTSIKTEWKGQTQFTIAGTTNFATLIKVIGELHENFGVLVIQAKITKESQGKVSIEIQLEAIQ